MNRDEVEHIRADVHAAVLEAAQHDPTVTLEILWRLFDAVSTLALGATADHVSRTRLEIWGSEVLQSVQMRAVGKVSWGEPRSDEPPEDHRV